MSSLISKNVASYKIRPTSSVPYRTTAIQCIRSCPSCIPRYGTNSSEFEDMLALKSFDNLVTRKSMWFSRYQSIQYHIGQFDLLNNYITEKTDYPVLYVVATTSLSDICYLNMVLVHMNQTTCSIYNQVDSTISLKEFLDTNNTIALPILLKSCTSNTSINNQSKKNPMSAKCLRDLLKPLVDEALRDSDFNYLIVPVVITKDHDRFSLFGVGSICIQLLEAFRLQDYIVQVTRFEQSTHLVQHLYFDLAQNAAIFPSHLVAFLLLYLDRFKGVSHQDLINYLNWFRKTSIDTGIQIGFTGDSKSAIHAALNILEDYIYSNSNGIYLPKNVEELSDYAGLVTPRVSYYGVIATAILIEHNKMDENVQLVSLSSGVKVKVEKNKVLETSYRFAELLEQKIPCRRPCRNIETSIFEALTQMETAGHYLKIEEPIISTFKTRHWDGDSDNDEDYYKSNREDPRFRSWLILSERDYRIDRLNLFINAVAMYL